MTYIYILVDPRNDAIKYIGKANNCKSRLREHIYDARVKKNPSSKKCWIKSLIAKNLKPVIEILDEVPLVEWEFWERHYISLFKSWGIKLLNHMPGGGGRIEVSEQQKQTISSKLKGRKSTRVNFRHTEETKQYLRELSSNKKQSQETIQKRIETRKVNNKPNPQKGKKCPQKGHPISKEQREHNSKIHAGIKRSKESIQKGKETRKRNNLKVSKETREKQSRAKKNKPLTKVRIEIIKKGVKEFYNRVKQERLTMIF